MADISTGEPSERALKQPSLSTRRSGWLRALVRGMRPVQWPKNLLVFVAPAAAGTFHEHSQVLRAAGAFGIFCIAASAVYLFNDCVDAEADRQHEIKKLRPVASGALPQSLALLAAGVLVVAALVGSWFLEGWELVLVIITYLVISGLYSLRLKREPVIELAAVASGFVLRAVAGGTATHVPLSSWFLTVACFGALFVVTGKRLAELTEPNVGVTQRSVLGSYTPRFLQMTLVLSASVTMAAYCLWAFERTGLIARPGVHAVWIELTIVPIALGILLMMLRLETGRGGIPEELMLHDRVLQTLFLSWVALFAIGLYG